MVSLFVENCLILSREQPTRRDSDLEANGKLSTSIGSSLKFVENSLPFTPDQQARLIDPATSKLCCTNTNGQEICKDDHLYEDLNVDDIDLSFENYEELFGGSQNQSGQLFGDAGIGSLFEMDISATTSNCQGGLIAEAREVFRGYKVSSWIFRGRWVFAGSGRSSKQLGGQVWEAERDPKPAR